MFTKAITDKVYIPLQGIYYKKSEESREKIAKINNNPIANNTEDFTCSSNNYVPIQSNAQETNDISIENNKETYDIIMNLYLLDSKIIHKTFQKVQEAEILEMQIDIQTLFYREFKEDAVSIVLEVIIRKNYDTTVKLMES
jgi:hypothetical protein